jgi:thioredoxin 1
VIEPLIAELDEQSFDSQTFDSSDLVLVFFGAEERCSVCRNLYPIVETVAAENSGKLVVKKVDVDRYPKLAGRFRLRGIPVLILFNDGMVQDKLGGYHDKNAIESFLEKFLN